RGEPWGFAASCTAGERIVTVRAIHPWATRFSPRTHVIDWAFVEHHPLLWDFGLCATIYVNSSFDRRALFDGLLALELPNVSESVVWAVAANGYGLRLGATRALLYDSHVSGGRTATPFFV